MRTVRLPAYLFVIAALAFASLAVLTLPAQAEPVRPQSQVVALAPDPGAAADTAGSSSDPPGWSAEVTGLAEVSVLGLTWHSRGGEADDGARVELRSRTGATWSEWEQVELLDAPPGAGAGPGDRPLADETQVRGTEPMAVIGAEQVQVRLLPQDGQVVLDAEVSVWDPGSAAADLAPTDTVDLPADVTADMAPGSAPMPVIHSRAAWGADESLRTWNPSLGNIQGAIVHHTAGVNGYTAAQVPAIIRGIYAYHAVTLGWGDIGYHVMVDAFGRAWEGRYGGLHRHVVAAHTASYNTFTFGISVLGNFEHVQVPAVAFERVARVLAWKLGYHGIPADGTYEAHGATHNVVLGHGDVNATLCPGLHFRHRMGELTTLTKGYQGTVVPGQMRLSGTDRYGTSVALSRAAFGPDVTEVFIASGADFPDALAAGPLAAHAGAPLLLVRPGSVPGAVVTELQRLKPQRITVLGGPTTVEGPVLTQLASLTGALVTRTHGGDRYGTAAAAAESWHTAETVVVVSGAAFPDALTGGAVGAQLAAPLLLTAPGSLPGVTAQSLSRLQPSRVAVIGGATTVSEAVLASIRQVVPGAVVTRYAGENRYETSALASQTFWPAGADAVLFGRGDNFPDALAGVQLAAVHDAPILLSRPTCIPSVIAAEYSRLDTRLRMLIGGPESLHTHLVTRPC